MQSDLADTIEDIGVNGMQSFYDGAIAEAIVSVVAATGGCLTREDLANYAENLLIRARCCVMSR